MASIGVLSGEKIPDTISCYERGKIIKRSVTEEMRGIIDRAKAGVCKALSWENTGIDMRGKTTEKIRTHYMSGMIHYLDDTTFRIIELVLNNGGKLTVFLKNCLENGNWKAFAHEFYTKLGPSIMTEILSVKKRVSSILHSIKTSIF
ncbi:TPA: hypothetical protein DCZ36_03130 [Candidatus Gracilibacteria bacterium]|nr:hypothetical protein [Candidatus Gracilibacteria bacterium]